MTARSIGAAQTTPVRGDVAANLEQHLRLAPLATAARAYEMTLIVGAPVRIGSALHIGAFVVRPDGAVDVYTKHHLGAFSPDANPGGTIPPAEATVFVSGDRNPPVAIGAHTAAVAICADTGHASHAERAARRGATTYLASMFVTPASFPSEAATMQSYAARHGMAVVLANCGGPTGGLSAAGRSSIWSQTGELLAELPTSGEGVAVAVETDDGWRAGAIAHADVGH